MKSSYKVGMILLCIWLPGFTIEMGATLGHFKRFSKSEDLKTILLIFIGVWGTAIIFFLGTILYQIVIKPLIKEEGYRKKGGSKS